MIRKTSETRPLTGTIVNEYNDSQVNAYSTEYANDLNTYSTTEQRVGTWIDGKPIYRKVCTGTTNNALSTTLNATNIETIIKTSGYIRVSSSVDFIMDAIAPIGDMSNSARIIRNGNRARLDVVSDFYNKSYAVVLEYTKTTD